MTYLIDQVNTIKNRKLILLLDRYSIIDKNSHYFQTLTVDENSAFYVSQEALATIKNRDSITDCYGLWQLLFLSGQINFEPDRQLIVTYEDDSQNSGFFLYYNHKDNDYRSGLIINEKLIGLFGVDLPEITIIQIDESKIIANLSNEVLRPLDRYKKEQGLIKTVAMYSLASIASITISIAVLLTFIMPSINELIFESDTSDRATLEVLERKLQRSTLDLRKLRKSKVSVTNNVKVPPLINILSTLLALEVPINLTASMNDKTGKLIFKKLEPWMSQLPLDIFTILEQEDGISISWNLL